MDRLPRTAGQAAPKVAVIALLVWAFGIFGLVSAVHSVHHLLDGDADAGQCTIAAAAQHDHGDSADLSPAVVPCLTAQEPPRSVAPAVRSTPMFRPDEGRAPPPTASA